MKHPINISAMFSSPEHHYFTRPKFDFGDAPTLEHDVLALKVGTGITGDRFEKGKYPISFINEEVVEYVCDQLGVACDSKLFRRNIVLSGVSLNDLIGQRFYIGEVGFEGLEHCAPCTWMNAVMKKGAYGLMMGRGGLRVRVIQSGCLQRGPNLLETDTGVIQSDPLSVLKKPKLP